MAKVETTIAATRAPRGTKPVTQAFFAALDSVPEAARLAVAKAAQGMIRDELKNRRDKLKAATANEKTRRSAAAPRPPKSAGRKPAEPNAAATPRKRRSRKQADVPVAA